MQDGSQFIKKVFLFNILAISNSKWEINCMVYNSIQNTKYFKINLSKYMQELCNKKTKSTANRN